MKAIGGGAPEPTEELEPMAEETGEMGAPPAESEYEEQHGESLIALPAGFKAPAGVMEGESFATTVRGKIVGGEFQVEEIGDMPISGQAAAEQQAPPPEEESPEATEYNQRKQDETAARSAFQTPR